ncbi:MAG TPA: ABC transporter substrate-binding protein [Syntrophorhabdaceae bacterium]|nr:ABC transporter substrate-binding protein [Syntrophorhabdaceae bacterium]HQM81433.1 ABC transporter substrate-binding protein [Syntrophorhabdaceae bacterium]
MKIRSAAVFSLVLFLSLLIASPAAFSAEKEIKIGVLYPLSGALATIGRDLQRAAEVTADIINNKAPGVDIPMAQWGGIPNLGGAKIKLIFKDHRGEPDRGADLAKSLILDDKVVGLMGAYNSAVTKTVSAVAERYGIPMINDSSTSPDLTERGFKWFWRTTPHDNYFNRDLFELLKGLTEGKVKGVKAVPKKNLQNLAYACENTEWGSSVAKSIEGYAKEYGFTITKGLLYNANAPDLTSEAKALVAAKPDAMLFAAYLSDSLLMIRTLKGMKAQTKFFWGQDAGFEMADFAKTLGADINGVLTRTVFIDKITKVKKVAGQVNAIYKAKYGDDLTGATARSVVGVQAWAYVLNKAASTDPKAIQKACNEINIPADELVMPWAGVKFDAKGQNVLGRGLIGQYQKTTDGKVSLEIVYPFDLATANFIYPFPGWK